MYRTVLVLYSNNEYPERNMARNLLYSFRKYSDNKVIYFNCFTNKIPCYVKRISFDIVIFHQSITFCGNQEQYLHRIESFTHFLSGSKAIRVALFQDEYINTDFSVQFLNQLEIDYAYSVAPQTEWGKIYHGLRKECTILPMLTGYIEKKPAEYYELRMCGKRPVDIGYRAVWNKSSIVLGKFGYDKIKIAKTFIKNLKDDKRHCLDIKVGSPYILNGNEWTDFLASCRFVLGVESGGSVLDHDGSIGKAVNAAINADGDISVEELYKRYVEKEDGSYNLRAISPRHFEAIEEGTCQILYEGDYNGILEPNVHFIELKKDHSNLKEVIAQLDNEEQRIKIVNRAFHDIVESEKYTYEHFVHGFYDTVCKGKEKKTDTFHFGNILYSWLASAHEYKIKLYIYTIMALKKRNILNVMKKNKATVLLLKWYYAKRL